MFKILSSCFCTLLLFIAMFNSGCAISDNFNVETYLNRSTYIHPYFKMEFPKSVGPLTRRITAKYNNSEKDIGVSYDSWSSIDPVIVTVFAYPVEETIEDKNIILNNEFEKRKLESLNGKALTILSEKTAYLSQNGLSYEGKYFVYSDVRRFGNKHYKSINETYIFLYGDWFIKYLASFPEYQKKEANEKVNEFMGTLRWPSNKEMTKSL